MFLHSFNGNFFPMKDACGQSCFNISLLKNFAEVFNLSGTGRGNDWDRDAFTNMFYKFNVKAAVRTVPVDTVE
jgi:hypothetical protein